MSTDYKEIGQNPRINYRKIFTPYSDRTHFIYELVQNADDNESQSVELQLYESELIVWNDGCRFTEGDVRSICSIGFSNKDLTQIGTFGMGFKAVYTYTDNPEVYSGDECFRISINNPTSPEGIDIDVVDARVVEQLDKGRTIFRLPFRKNLRQEEEIARLKDRLCDLEKRALLFLRNLRTVQWYDEKNGQKGSYSCQRRPHGKIENASVVELKASINGIDQPSETFLVFRKEVQPPQTVIDELLQQSEDDDERQRILKSAKKLQPVEVAFKFQDNKITAMNNCVLFSYFPTQKETHLKFLIQASYKTTLARDNLEDNNQWNEWLVRETAGFLPEVLEQLKVGELLDPAFFNILPLKEDSVPDEFSPTAEALQKAMQERDFVPTQDDMYAKAENVFYPHRESLRELVKSDWLYPNSNWLHPDIGDTEDFRRCFKVMREAGVKEIEVSQVLDWLEKQDLNWFEDRCEKWLRSLYVYLNNQKSELKRIMNLPLVRLESGRHVCANEQSVFFPPSADEAREEIEPFLRDLPILQSALLKGEERNEIEAFLKSVGIKVLRRVDMILEGICPQYLKSLKPSMEENHLHVRYFFKVWSDVSESESSRLEEKISEISILRVCKGVQHGIDDKSRNSVVEFRYAKPCDAYLPQVYIGDDHLETYFSVCNSEVWFVDEGYLEDKSDAKDWIRFLKAIGAKDTPLIFEKEVTGSTEECGERDIAYENSTKPFEDGEFKDIWSRPAYHYFDGHIVDRYLFGLSRVLTQIDRHNKINVPQALWGLLVKLVSPLPSEESRQNALFREFFQGDYRWYYRTNRWKSFDATFYGQLKSTPWIPDEQGNLHIPSECFAPISENRKLLGDSVIYLPVDFDISTEPAKWLAEKLGVRMEADTESVLNHLQILRDDKEVSIKKIETLYRFLYGDRPRRKVGSYMVDSEPPWRSKFEEETLIFIPNPGRCWWRADEVFWEDESVVFGDDRGYLTSHYAKDLKSFFTDSLVVSEHATASDYVHRIHKVKLMERAMDQEIQILYERLWQVMQESNSGSSNRLDVDPREKFMEESLIFAPNSERCWWRADELFWEDESSVFGNSRGYLKAYYPETLKLFFTALGTSERAAPLDYVSGIKEIASVGRVENSEIRKRIKRLYSRVWQSLQEGGTWQETEEWKQTCEGRYWLGKKGNEWGFFFRHELVCNDHHEYIAEIFEEEVPFWAFDDLFDLAKNLEIEGCSQAEIEFNPKGDQEELTNLSEEVRNLRLCIHAFLNSPRLCESHEEGKSAHNLDGLSVCLVEELETMYTLKEISLTSPNPRPSFLDGTNQKVTLWLALEADKDDYSLLIGDAIQDYFRVKDLGRFAEHLLTKDKEKVLARWKREGLQTNINVLSPEKDSKESEEEQTVPVDDKLPSEFDRTNPDAVVGGSDVGVPRDDEDNDSVGGGVDKSEVHTSNSEGNDSTADESDVEMPLDSETPEVDKADNNSTSDKSETRTNSSSDMGNISSPDTRDSTKTEGGTAQPASRKSEHEMPTVNDWPEVSSGDINSETKGSGTYRHTPSRTRGTSRSGGHSMSTSSSRKGGGGGHGGSGGGGEGEDHEDLKRDLANNPSRFGEGLKLVKIEYTFGSGDRVDILLTDGSENPVTVEVETGFSSGSGRYVGVWQAVKYQHLAAMEHNLACEQVRSILAAPEIPKDVKEKCEELGIEPFEVSD